MFITRIHKYAVKLLSTGAGRICIKNADALRKAGLVANTPIRISYSKHRIVVKEDVNGNNKVMDTGRGATLEIRNKDVAKSVGDLSCVTVTFRKGMVIITIHQADKQKMEREQSIINALTKGEPIRTASFFSGLGMLSWWIKKGLEKAGIRSQITFANDMSETAMECNLAGNAMWDDATPDAYAVIDTLDGIDMEALVNAHLIEIGYPCIAQSTLCKKENRDTKHPLVGTLFVKLLEAIRKINPAMVCFENTPAFGNSETLDFIKREMPGYRFEQVVLDGHAFGELEGRKRVCVVAVSDGLPELNLNNFSAPKNVERKTFSSVFEDISLDSPLWRRMEHLKRKTNEATNNFKNMLYTGVETTIATITATYAAPKAGTPMIAHPLDSDLQRQVTCREHADIRELPVGVHREVMEVAYGGSPMVSRKGSFTAAHRLLGNGVSKKAWMAMGAFLGNYLMNCVSKNTMQFDFAA
jgi:DNA (cytosine-5)-methyltransferase 1